MIIKCITNKTQDLPEEYHQSNLKDIPLIDNGQMYVVFGILFEGSKVLYLTDLNRNFLYKVAAPLFEVVEDSLPRDWVFKQLEGGYGMSFREWFETDFYWNLSERKKAEVAQIKKKKEEYSSGSGYDMLVKRSINEQSKKLNKERGWEI